MDARRERFVSGSTSAKDSGGAASNKLRPDPAKGARVASGSQSNPKSESERSEPPPPSEVKFGHERFLSLDLVVLLVFDRFGGSIRASGVGVLGRDIGRGTVRQVRGRKEAEGVGLGFGFTTEAAESDGGVADAPFFGGDGAALDDGKEADFFFEVGDGASGAERTEDLSLDEGGNGGGKASRFCSWRIWQDSANCWIVSSCSTSGFQEM